MSRRLAFWLLGIVVVLLAASFAVWFWAESTLERGFAIWQAQAATQGWTVKTGAVSRGGWPLTADLIVHNLSMTGDETTMPGGAAYTADQMVLRLDPRHLDNVTAHGEGAQSLRLGPTKPLPFTAERFVLTFPLTPHKPATSAALDGKELHFTAPAEGLTIGLLEGQADWSVPHTISGRLSAEAITLPPPPAPQAALGSHIASATIAGTVSGTVPAAAATPEAAAAGWRDSGGAVMLRHIAVGWGPLGVTGSATFKLDAALQPDVTATLRLVGIDETLTALGAARTISPRAAQAAKAVITLMAQAPEGGGGTPGVELPLTLHDGSLSLGMIPLATIRKLDWPSGQ